MKSKYRVKFFNCICREALNFGEFQPYIINKKDNVNIGVIHLCIKLKMFSWWSMPLILLSTSFILPIYKFSKPSFCQFTAVL